MVSVRVEKRCKETLLIEDPIKVFSLYKSSLVAERWWQTLRGLLVWLGLLSFLTQGRWRQTLRGLLTG